MTEPEEDELDEKEEFSGELTRKMGAIGLFGMFVAEEYEGQGMDYLSYIIATEEIARVDGSQAATIAAGNSLGIAPIYYFGNESQKKKYLPKLCSGGALWSFGLTEPTAGSDAGGSKTTAILDGNEWVLNGSKIFITNADTSDYMVLAARTGSFEDRHRGISLFVVNCRSEGIAIKKIPKIGAGAASACEIVFEDVKVPEEDLLGEKNKGFYTLMECLGEFRIVFGVMALGIAQGAFEEALQYAKERETFGKPIGKHQAIQFMLSDMYTQIEASRLMIYRAAWMIDQGMTATKECSAAKLMASETATNTAVKAMQIFGGYGYTLEFPIQRYFREAKLGEIGEGTSEIQRIIIAKQLGL